MYLTLQWRVINAASLRKAYEQLLSTAKTQENATEWNDLRYIMDMAILHIDISCGESGISKGCENVPEELDNMISYIGGDGSSFPLVRPLLENFSSHSIIEVINDVYKPHHIYHGLDIDLSGMFDVLRDREYPDFANPQSAIDLEIVMALTLFHGMEDFHRHEIGCEKTPKYCPQIPWHELVDVALQIKPDYLDLSVQLNAFMARIILGTKHGANLGETQRNFRNRRDIKYSKVKSLADVYLYILNRGRNTRDLFYVPSDDRKKLVSLRKTMETLQKDLKACQKTAESPVQASRSETPAEPTDEASRTATSDEQPTKSLNECVTEHFEASLRKIEEMDRANKHRVLEAPAVRMGLLALRRSVKWSGTELHAALMEFANTTVDGEADFVKYYNQLQGKLTLYPNYVEVFIKDALFQLKDAANKLVNADDTTDRDTLLNSIQNELRNNMDEIEIRIIRSKFLLNTFFFEDLYPIIMQLRSSPENFKIAIEALRQELNPAVESN